MGNCTCLNSRARDYDLAMAGVEYDLAMALGEANLKKVYGPTTHPNGNIIKFHLDRFLWKTDVNAFIDNKMIDIEIAPYILSIIFGYIMDEMHTILQCPTQWIIETAMTNPSLQPFYRNTAPSWSIKTIMVHLKKVPSRQSWSISDANLINQLIDEIKFDTIMPRQILSRHGYKQFFHEIVVYEPGGYFDIHVDSVFHHLDDSYEYTLLLIPPAQYKGGELIIADKEIKINPSAWQSILFHKHIEHRCKVIRSGYKIVFKIHICMPFYEAAEIPIQNQVGFEPLATGFNLNAPPGPTFGEDDIMDVVTSDIYSVN
eukprot:133718_1